MSMEVIGLSTGVQTAVGKFVWHENNSNDIEKAKNFYTELFGWETEVWKPGEMDYPMIKAGDKTHGGFGTAEGGAPSHWLGHVLVENVDDTTARAMQAGGNVVAGPFDIPEIGRMAVIADPQGAILSAYASPAEGPLSEGVFVWDELVTTDVEAAKRFYSEVFGWTSRDMDMGEMTYTIFQNSDDVDVAGALPRPAGMQAPPHWLPYIYTDDVDKTAAQAKELGANVFMEAFDVPNVGRIAVLQDPVGAVFGLFKPSAQ
jgi:predicted enzyme related to lactoylglutathione lyase